MPPNNYSGGEMVSELALCHGRIKPKTRNCISCISAKTQHYGVTAKTGWLIIRIMCLDRATCISIDNCFTEVAL